jgi:hypothetical protein
MNFESVKLFGLWVSDALFWLIESLGPPDGTDHSMAGDGDELSTGGSIYLSRSDALLHGGMGVDIGNGTYV